MRSARAAPLSARDGTAPTANVLVCVRVRPQSEAERQAERENLVEIVDEHCVCFDPQRDPVAGAEGATAKLQRRLATKGERGRRCREQFFKFDRVFGPDSTQEDIFQTTGKGVIDSVLTGHNATVFAYGATGSGKTHTMIGNKEVGGGVMVLSVREIFSKMEQRKLDSSYKVCISYLEVYNETIRDLLVPSGPLALRESARDGCQVANLTKHYPKDAQEIFGLIQTGNGNRIQSATEANAQSSRSHAVLQIMIEQHDRGTGIQRAVKTGKLSLIDLAGSERASASTNRGQLLKEGANINKSLLALSSCINALCKSKASHVPFRNSKLTRLLKDSLGGNCRTVMISNISPCGLNYEDTHNTLKYANRAKEIKTKVSANVVSVTMHVAEYQKVIEEQKKTIAELRRAVTAADRKLASAGSPKQAAYIRAQAEQIQQFRRLVAGLGGEDYPMPTPLEPLDENASPTTTSGAQDAGSGLWADPSPMTRLSAAAQQQQGNQQTSGGAAKQPKAAWGGAPLFFLSRSSYLPVRRVAL